MAENIFPTAWQRVIFRNYGYAYTENIAKVIRTDAETVKKQAIAMGLEEPLYCDLWTEKGFVTVIRNNYDILPDDDVAVLIGKSREEYDKLLIEYDFLNVKLGDKPRTEKAVFSPLTQEQLSATRKIRDFILSKRQKRAVAPFDFYADAVLPAPVKGESAIKDFFCSHYSADYGGVLNDDGLKDYSPDYLKRISGCGVNGLWIHESLKNISPFPFDPALSAGYEKRIENLKRLTERCAEYGVKIYLYLNEPRSLPAAFFDKHPNLKGAKTDDGYCLCTSVKEVRDYLYGAMKFVAESAPLLEGVMTITMSENPTNCYSRAFDGKEKGQTSCPRCEKRAPEEIAAEVNNIMSKGLFDGNGKTRLIANLWGWSSFTGWSMDAVLRGIDLLDDRVEVLCVSEHGAIFKRGGVSSEVEDYSVSVVGPSELTVKKLTYAKNKGHKIWAKVQLNNSWECSGVPYIPAFDLMTEHIRRLKKLGVCGIMTGWSLGGYPGGALPLCVSICKNDNFDEEGWYSSAYGINADRARKAVKKISAAFTNFPFSINSLYFGGQNLACGNLYSLKPDGRRSTMVCFTFDDYETWSNPFGAEIYESLITKVADGMESAAEELYKVEGNAAYEEFKRCALGASLHFRAAKNLAAFSRLKRAEKVDKKAILAVIQDEYACTEKLYRLVAQDAKIGYEMTNHYFYTERTLLEKMLNLKDITEKLD